MRSCNVYSLIVEKYTISIDLLRVFFHFIILFFFCPLVHLVLCICYDIKGFLKSSTD